MNKYGTINLNGDQAALKQWANEHGVVFGTSKNGIVVAKSSVPYVQSILDQEATNDVSSDGDIRQRRGDGDNRADTESTTGTSDTKSGNGRDTGRPDDATEHGADHGNTGSMDGGRNTDDGAVTTEQPTSNGKQVTVHTPAGKPVDTEYRLMEADDLIASHDFDGNTNSQFPQHLQPRDRSRATARNQLS